MAARSWTPLGGGMSSQRWGTRAVGLAVLVALLWFGAVVGAQAKPARARSRSTAERIVGVLRAVTPHRVTIEGSAGGPARDYRIDVLTTVCYEPNLCLQSGNTSPLLPGATVTAQVATNKRGVAHASTIFVKSVSATIQIDAVDGDAISGHSTRHGESYTIVRRPFTIVVDERGATPGALLNLQVGSVLYFTGLAGLDTGNPVTIAVRLFPS
jgi:hypothetical protein